jgi:hypothetical protein
MSPVSLGAAAEGGARGGVKALLPDGLIDELLAGARTEEEITGRGGLLSRLTKRLVERALEVELTDHLSCAVSVVLLARGSDGWWCGRSVSGLAGVS